MSPSRPSSERLALALTLVLALFALPLVAQERGVAVVDQERMFGQSAFGQRVLSEIDARSEALAAENRRIESELTAEERALTDLRPDLEPSAFRDRARAFDEKVRAVRAEQDAKARALASYQDEERQDFARRVAPILSGLLGDLGAAVLLDRRLVLAAAPGTDVTAQAVERIDAALGDGAAAPD